MATQYPPLTAQVGLPKDKSAKEQLLALMRIMGQMPTPIGAESADAKAIAEWLAKNKGGQAVEQAAPKLIEEAPKVAEQAAQAPAEGGGLTMEKLQQMAAQKPNPPAMGAPAGGVGMEQAAAQAPKVAKKGANKIGEQITQLAGKAPKKADVLKGAQFGQPEQMQQEFDSLRQLLDSARKLKAKGIESQIGDLYGEMMAGGGPRSPTPEATLNHVAMKRQMIQHQLQRLLDAIAGKK